MVVEKKKEQRKNKRGGEQGSGGRKRWQGVILGKLREWWASEKRKKEQHLSMFGLVQVQWFGFIPKRPKQPHPQRMYWWVMGHSSPHKYLPNMVDFTTELQQSFVYITLSQQTLGYPPTRLRVSEELLVVVGRWTPFERGSSRLDLPYKKQQWNK